MIRIKSVAKILYVAVVVLAFVGIVSSGYRTLTLLQSVPPTDAYNIRYSQHSLLTLLHVVPGLIFFVLGPLQFVTTIRKKFPTFHKWSGYVYLLAATSVGISVYFLVFAIGFAGYLEVVNVTLFASLFLTFLGMAVYRILRREVTAHREWMIRAFAIGLASASTRLVFLIITATTNFSFAESFLTALWIAFPLHLIVAELWVRATRNKK